jgi:hypothetical protein
MNEPIKRVSEYGNLERLHRQMQSHETETEHLQEPDIGQAIGHKCIKSNYMKLELNIEKRTRNSKTTKHKSRERQFRSMHCNADQHAQNPDTNF